jgi:hypothetical protein
MLYLRIRQKDACEQKSDSLLRPMTAEKAMRVRPISRLNFNCRQIIFMNSRRLSCTAEKFRQSL